MLIITQHRKLFARLMIKHLITARLKKMLIKFFKVLINQFLSAVKTVQQVSIMLKEAVISALKSLMLLGRAMQTVHLQFRT